MHEVYAVLTYGIQGFMVWQIVLIGVGGLLLLFHKIP
jgi:hypothetical protein